MHDAMPLKPVPTDPAVSEAMGAERAMTDEKAAKLRALCEEKGVEWEDGLSEDEVAARIAAKEG